MPFAFFAGAIEQVPPVGGGGTNRMSVIALIGP